MTKDFEDFIAALPQSLEPEFVMASPDEPIRLAMGRFDLLRDGHLLGHLEGEIALKWVPKLRLICTGESDSAFTDIFDDRDLHLHVPHLGLTAEAFVTSAKMGHRREIQALLIGADNPELKDTQQFRFYLVNFPFFLGEPVRTGSGPFAGTGRDRLSMKAGPLKCTIDRIRRTGHFEASESEPGYLLTHVGEIQRPGQSMTPSELQEILGTLYWLFAFMRGARTGPILPSVGSPFAKHWISVTSGSVDEPRRVDSWMPDRSPINVDSLFEGFFDKWSDSVWNEALRTTIAWYIAANSPSTPNEARITLCQIALEVLASLRGLESGAAHKRIRSLLEGLNIPTQVPPRLQALDDYATSLRVDAPECLTRIRNKFEHPTAKNRRLAGTVDGFTRMQAAQYGMELFELCLLAMMSYQGKYARRAFQGWKGDDEIPVPWG
jgi:hypothetical protein